MALTQSQDLLLAFMHVCHCTACATWAQSVHTATDHVQ